MKKLPLLLFAVGFLASGCMTYERSEPHLMRVGDQVRPCEHFKIGTYGFYLWNTVPLVTGCVGDYYGQRFFQDEVKLDNLERYIVRDAEKRGLAIEDLTPVCLTDVYYGTLGLVWSREIQFTGVFVYPEGTTLEDIAKKKQAELRDQQDRKGRK